MKEKKYSYLELINENSYCRKFYLELYTDWDNINDLLEKVKSYSSYNLIFHDKDIWTDVDYRYKKEYMDSAGIKVGDTKKPHYHVILTFHNPRYKSTIINELFGKDKFDECKQFVNKILNYRKTQRYQTHEDEDDKYHYSGLEVKGKGEAYADYFRFAQDSRTPEESCKQILSVLLEKQYRSTVDITLEICDMGLYNIFIRGYSLYSDILEEVRSGHYHQNL